MKHRIGVWKILSEALQGSICEEKQFNGNTAVRLKDIDKLLRGDGTEHNPGLTPRQSPKPEGGSVDCDYDFDPSIPGWNMFSPSLDKALITAATDKAGVGSPDQYAGNPQGTHVLKKNWGGKVVGAAGKPRSDFERMPSAMDRYDVLMIADIVSTQKQDRKTGKTITKKGGKLKKFVYSPSIGSFEERKVRLQALAGGHTVSPLKRRPQGDVPGDVKDPTRNPRDPQDVDKIRASVDDVPKFGTGRTGLGAKVQPAHDDDRQAKWKSDSDARHAAVVNKWVKHSADYEPKASNPDERERVRKAPDDDDTDVLFPKKK